MAETQVRAEDRVRVPALALRFVLAAIAILGFLFVRDTLDPTSLVAARFGLGITLFALFIDLARALAGASPNLGPGYRPHEQEAEALVDETYREVHADVRRYLDEGEWTEAYGRLLDGVLEARGVPAHEREALIGQARAEAGGSPHVNRPFLLSLVAGLSAVLGVATAAGVLLHALEAPVLYPVVAVVGLGIYLLQARLVQAGSQLATGLVGLAGAAMILLGGTGLVATGAQTGRLLQGTGTLLALATGGLLWFHTFQAPTWAEVRNRLKDELTTLRRAFLVTLLGGLVLFPFKPLLSALFESQGWSLSVPYRIAVIGYATVATFLALELAGTWYALDQGEREERRLRQRRVQANQALLERLDQPTPHPTTQTGGNP